MTIVHDQWGEAEGVEEYTKEYGWAKHENGAITIYYRGNGWREKVEERREDVTDRCNVVKGITLDHVHYSQQRTMRAAYSCNEFKFRMVERYDLPEDWHRDFFGWLPPQISCDVDERMNQFKKPCLIIERKVEP
jgi:hypothetical protein